MYGRTSTVVKGALGAVDDGFASGEDDEGDQGKGGGVGSDRPEAAPGAARRQCEQAEAGDGRRWMSLDQPGFDSVHDVGDEVRRRGFAGEGSVERLFEFGVGFVDVGLVHNGLYFSTRAAFSRSKRRVRCR